MKSRTLLSLTLVAIFILMASSVSAQPPRVNVMPGNEPGLTYAYTWSGRALVVWGNVHDGTPPYTYEWNFGDGSPTVSGSVTNPRYIAVTHTYATAGPKQAVLTVTDASSLSNQDIVEIEVAPIAFDSVQINAAIEDGLRYLYLHQLADGRWHDYGYDVATTALAVLAFENQGHLPINDFNEDIYAEYVRAGLDYLTSTLTTCAVAVQGAGDPEEMVPGNMDNNGIGVYHASNRPVYEIGMVMMAMVGAGPLELGADTLMIAPNGPAGIVGRTYRELVVDMVDYCAWAQNEPGHWRRGGWRYHPNYGSSDNSVSQWPAIGLEAAETNWGISAPPFVKSELEIWINYSQASGGWADGAFYYYPSAWAYGPMGVTGAGLCEMAYCDIPQSDSRFERALSFLEREWERGDNRGFNYGMYAIAKGCRIAVDDFGELSEVNYICSLDVCIEWYPDYAAYLLGIQNANGRFPALWGGFGIYMDHSWALLVLQPTVVGNRPIAIIDGPSSVPPDFAFDLDGSGSYHRDSSKEIVEWLWDFDKSDGIDWDNPDAIGSIAGGVSYSLPGGVVADTFVVTLRVADDSDPEMTDIAEHVIIVNFENHPPIADAGGPYSGKVGELICFDGTGSVDPDTAVGDYIATYAWDIDGDGQFDDCFDSICCHSWAYEYSGYIGLVVTDSYGGESADTTHVTVYVSEYDVYLTASDISFSIPHPQPSDAITITAIIHCDSASDPILDDVLVRFYDGDPDIAVHQIGDDQVIPGMVAGDAIAVAVDYTVGDTLPREIYVRVDPRDDLEEYNEDNNEAFKIIKAVLPVAFDIKPGSCPNPLNVKAPKDYSWTEADESSVMAKAPPGGIQQVKAVLPVAILGTADFDVADIDPTTVMLEGVPTLRWNIEDVSTPVGDSAAECECNTLGPDGYADLTLKFDRSLIVEALGEVYNGDTVSLTMTGELSDGAAIEGTDCVVIRGGDEPAAGAPPSGESPEVVLVGNYPNPFNPTTEIIFSLPSGSHVKLDVFNVMGQKVGTLVDGQLEAGEHIVQWDGSNVASGVYFYRLQADDFVDTKKMILMK